MLTIKYTQQKMRVTHPTGQVDEYPLDDLKKSTAALDQQIARLQKEKESLFSMISNTEKAVAAETEKT